MSNTAHPLGSDREEFYRDDTTDERRVEMLREVQRRAEQEEFTKDAKCFEGETIFYVPFDRALIPGHIYSELGMREWGITGCCEFHFDDLMREPDDPEEQP